MSTLLGFRNTTEKESNHGIYNFLMDGVIGLNNRLIASNYISINHVTCPYSCEKSIYSIWLFDLVLGTRHALANGI